MTRTRPVGVAGLRRATALALVVLAAACGDLDRGLDEAATPAPSTITITPTTTIPASTTTAATTTTTTPAATTAPTATPTTTAEAPGPPVLTPGGIDEIQAGAARGDVESFLQSLDPTTGGACTVAAILDRPDTLVYVDNETDIVHSIVVLGPSIASHTGLSVGDPLDDLLAVHPEAVATPDPPGPPGAVAYDVGVIYLVVNGNIASMTVGNLLTDECR